MNSIEKYSMNFLEKKENLTNWDKNYMNFHSWETLLSGCCVLVSFLQVSSSSLLFSFFLEKHLKKVYHLNKQVTVPDPYQYYFRSHEEKKMDTF